MSSDFERRLRDALHAAAQEVEPSPQTWQRVSAGVRRRRLWQWLSVGVPAVAAVVVAIAVVPTLIGSGVVGFDPEPAAPPAAPGGAPAAALPAGAVTTDGSRLVVQRGVLGTDTVEVPDADLSSVAVWPRSTARAFQVLAVDRSSCRLLLYRSGFEAPRPVDAGAPVCAPVAFSPEGRHLAWIDAGGDGPTLHTIGWDHDGPRPQDGAAFPLDADVTDLQVQDWVWSDVAGEEAVGHLVVRAAEPDLQAYRLRIERQIDGALAMPTRLQLEPVRAGTAGSRVVAEADAGGGVRYQLRVADDATAVELVRIASGEELTAPAPGGSPSRDAGAAEVATGQAWLVAVGGHALYGDGTQAFSAYVSDGQWTLEVLPEVRAADFLPRRLPRPPS